MYPCALIRTHSRLTRRSAADLRAIDRATQRIAELTTILDTQMGDERRPEEQLRHLRQATGQITRTANDGIQAYRRITQAIRDETQRTDADPAEIEHATLTLSKARGRMLEALEVASHRYPWAEPWRPAVELEPEPEESKRPGG